MNPKSLASVFGHADTDPRNALSGRHDEVVEKFITRFDKVTLRWFSWEPPGAHRYQQMKD